MIVLAVSRACLVAILMLASNVCFAQWGQAFMLSIQAAPPSAGICGSANGVVTSSAPTTNLCSVGTPSAVTGTGPWNWTCAGAGTPTQCSAPIAGGGGAATNSPVCNTPTTVNGITLDCTVFTGSLPDRTDTMIANISGGNGTFTLPAGVNDNANFKIVTGGWTTSWGSRTGITLQSNGAVSGKANGFQIRIASGAATADFNIGDPSLPYALSSKTVHVASGGGGAISTQISAASSGEVVFANPGTYNGFTMKAGVDVVSATVQNHLNGQTSRATVNGQIIPANNATLYGINYTYSSNHQMDASGTTNFRLVNDIFNPNNLNVGWLYFDNATGMHIEWVTFANGQGVNHPGGENNVHDGVFVHNVFNRSGSGNLGSGADGASNNTWAYNFQDHNDQNGVAGGNGGIGGFEIANSGSGVNHRSDYFIHDNYCIHNNDTTPSSFCWSLVGGWTNLQFYGNYCEDDTGGCTLEHDNEGSQSNPYALIYENNFKFINGDSRCFWDFNSLNSNTQLHDNRMTAGYWPSCATIDGASQSNNTGLYILASPFVAGAGP
jgi:hypothetical protein